MADDSSRLAQRIASDLLDLGAVIFAPDEPFTWASGLRSPIYCDNRLTLSSPAVRDRIAGGFAKLAEGYVLRPEVVVGTATAGIAHAAWLADQLNLPMAYVRSKPKAHGRGNRIEGRVEPGQRVVVVEDLVSTGGSSVTVVEALRAAGAEVTAVLAIFSYGLEASRHAFEEAVVPLYTLTDYETLLQVALEEGRVDDDALATLRAWRQDPEAWSLSVEE